MEEPSLNKDGALSDNVDEAGGQEKAEQLTAKAENSIKMQKQRGSQAKSGKKSKQNKKSYWAIKATVISFFLSAFFSFISELTASANNIIVTLLLLLFLISGAILADGIGVSVAACELSPLLSMASRKVPGSKMAIKLVKNAEVVSNICCDIIGDIFAILSGSCVAIVAMKIYLSCETIDQKIITIAVSSVVSALMVGGKAFLKNVAINRSKDFVMFTAKVLSLFSREKKNK